MRHLLTDEGPGVGTGSVRLTKCTRWEIPGGRTNTRNPEKVTCPDCLVEMPRKRKG